MSNVEEKEYLKSILDLRSMIEKVYFKEFEGTFDFPFRLNHTHIKTLMTLKFDGEKPMSVISDKLNLEKGSFTPVANNLIELGFIEKVLDRKDKRVFNLYLTEKGRDFTMDFCQRHHDYVNKLLEALSEDEKERYFTAIELINDITSKVHTKKVE
ncbi:MAG: transcriptional regulator [Herbinix sp.]|jgi:DNA-binding MarR family transcriptional regulator|nr:transcriptional regulator [Herbinix sp.]